MDPIKLEKLKAMKRYRNTRRELFLDSLTQCIVTIILIGLLLSSPLWIPALKLFFVSVPSLVELVLGPKCFFILCLLILTYLSFELRLSTSSATMDIYEDYMKRNTYYIQRQTISQCNNSGSQVGPQAYHVEEKMRSKCNNIKSQVSVKAYHVEEKMRSKCNNIKNQVGVKAYHVEEKKRSMHGVRYHQEDLHGDEKNLNELKQRSDDLIARVTQQWRHEATI